MSDGKDLVRVKLTFHKALRTKPNKQEEGWKQEVVCILCWRVALSARSSFKTAATPRTNADREGDATTARTDTTSDNQHATRTPLPSPHRRSSPDRHQHQRLSSLHHRRRPGKSLQQPKNGHSSTAPTTTKKNTRYTKSTTSRKQSATSSLSSKPRESLEKKMNMNVDLPSSTLEEAHQGYTYIEGTAGSGKTQSNIIP